MLLLQVDMSLVPATPWGSIDAVPSAARNKSGQFWEQVILAIQEAAVGRNQLGLLGCKLVDASLGHKGTSWYIKARANCTSIQNVRRMQRMLVRRPLLDINVQGIRLRLATARYSAWSINTFRSSARHDKHLLDPHQRSKLRVALANRKILF